MAYNINEPFSMDNFDPVDIVMNTDANFEELMAAVAERDTDKVENVVDALKESGVLSPDAEWPEDIVDRRDITSYDEQTDDSVDYLDAAAEDLKELNDDFDEVDDDDGEMIDAVVSGRSSGTDPLDDDYEVEDEFDEGSIEDGYDKSDSFVDIDESAYDGANEVDYFNL